MNPWTALRDELRLFLTALQFFTRIPVPAWVGWSPQQLNASARHFPGVGWVVGGVGAGVLLAALALWPPAVAVGLSMAAGILLTGAFHEDGFADSCDGFGGGFTRERVMAIMKDSRVGSYATVGVVLVLGLKAALLLTLVERLDAWHLLAALVASHAVSRLAALGVMARLDYVRDDDASKSKPIAQQRPGAGALAFAAAVALLPGLPLGLALVPAWAGAALVWALAVRYLRRRLGGYVGDALGATQQLAELAFLLGLTLRGGPWS
jgi:adenosylcobinamide-GDP ribazoletransferase